MAPPLAWVLGMILRRTVQVYIAEVMVEHFTNIYKDSKRKKRSSRKRKPKNPK
jgi:hypothetical protein